VQPLASSQVVKALALEAHVNAFEIDVRRGVARGAIAGVLAFVLLIIVMAS
jgi:hypothetical protein